MSLHEYIPSRRIDNDNCTLCGEPFEARCHPAISQGTVSRRTPVRTDCEYRPGRWSGGRCLECFRLYMASRRAVALTRSRS